MLYFNIASYKASIVSFNNVIRDYPDTKYKEQSFFYILKSHYLLASNSIDSKKKERFNNTVTAFFDFQNFQPTLSDLGDDSVNEGAKTKLAKEAESIYKSALQSLDAINAPIN
jgi:outer membrane protein assembly factor BamD